MKCIICDKKAVYRYSPDMDIEGLGACKKHNEDVFIAYFMLLKEGKKAYEKYIKSLRKK